MTSPFSYTNFFSNTGIFKELFEQFDYPWEALPNIEQFISSFTKSEHFSDFAEIAPQVYIGKNVSIDDKARISGAAVIGHNTVIGHAAFVRGGVLIGENVNVGHATEVKHSIVLNGAKLAHLNYIGDSIVGSNANISGGATLANWRFDKKEVVIRDDGEGIPTHMEKMGSIIGDDSFIGVSAVINPGTVLAKKTLVFPLVSVKGTHLTPETIK